MDRSALLPRSGVPLEPGLAVEHQPHVNVVGSSPCRRRWGTLANSFRKILYVPLFSGRGCITSARRSPVFPSLPAAAAENLVSKTWL